MSIFYLKSSYCRSAAFGRGLGVPDFIANTFVDAIGRHPAWRVTYSHYGTSIAHYTDVFSTILRTTRGSDLDRLITPALSSGAEPLCERLAVKTLSFGLVPATGFSLTDATTFRLIEKEE